MRTDGCAQVSAPTSTRKEARLLLPEAAECNGGAGALRGAGDALRLARACRGVLDVRDRLGDVGGDDLHLGHLLLSHVRGEPDLAQRALLGQHILGVEPGGARGQGERSGGWSGRCARLRARAAGQGAHLPCKASGTEPALAPGTSLPPPQKTTGVLATEPTISASTIRLFTSEIH